CAQARLGRVNEALASLSDSIDRGLAAPKDLLQDPDLGPVRADPRFSGLLARTKANQERR
ncbi:MAG: TPR end-of-group domain-containing protein, partial [Myxococcaceae bacterium]